MCPQGPPTNMRFETDLNYLSGLLVLLSVRTALLPSLLSVYNYSRPLTGNTGYDQ